MGAEHRYIQATPPLLFSRVDGALEVAQIGRVVAQHVDRAVLGFGPRHGVLHRVLVGNVGGHEFRRAALLPDRSRNCFAGNGVYISNQDPGAFFGEDFGDRATNPVRRTADDCGLFS